MLSVLATEISHEEISILAHWLYRRDENCHGTWWGLLYIRET